MTANAEHTEMHMLRQSNMQKMHFGRAVAKYATVGESWDRTCIGFTQIEQGCYRGILGIADNALVAMTLMIAESRPQEKDVITAILTNLIGN